MKCYLKRKATPAHSTTISHKGELIDEETGEVLEDYDPRKICHPIHSHL